jgi:hypothetical protein
MFVVAPSYAGSMPAFCLLAIFMLIARFSVLPFFSVAPSGPREAKIIS